MLESTTPEIEHAIVQLYLQGKNVTEIAAATGISRSVVTQVLFVRVPEHRSREKTALIEKIKATGVDPSLSLSANARRFNTDILTIKAVFHDLGLTANQEKAIALKEQAEKVISLRQKGLTYRAIGRELGISYERVRQILKRHVPIERREVNSNDPYITA